MWGLRCGLRCFILDRVEYKVHKGYAAILTDLTDPARPEILALAKGRDEAAGVKCLEALPAEQHLAVRHPRWRSWERLRWQLA